MYYLIKAPAVDLVIDIGLGFITIFYSRGRSHSQFLTDVGARLENAIKKDHMGPQGVNASAGTRLNVADDGSVKVEISVVNSDAHEDYHLSISRDLGVGAISTLHFHYSYNMTSSNLENLAQLLWVMKWITKPQYAEMRKLFFAEA